MRCWSARRRWIGCGYPRSNILRLHDAGFRDQRAHPRAGAPPDGRRSDARRTRSISARRRCRCSRISGIRTARAANVYDVTFENVQAGRAHQPLFRLANLHDALVVGTGDLSELALGWCTYGVGDHMSHYAVNASVPKTLIQHVIRWVADHDRLGADASARPARHPCDTESVLSWCPRRPRRDSQATEAMHRPLRAAGFQPLLHAALRLPAAEDRVPRLLRVARSQTGRVAGHSRRRAARILGSRRSNSHLRTFLYRFFKLSQFKRSCIPNAPKVGSGGSLSPRGDYRAPSDSEAEPWLRALELVPDQE